MSEEEINEQFRELMREVKQGRIRSPEQVAKDKEAYKQGYEQYKKSAIKTARLTTAKQYAKSHISMGNKFLIGLQKVRTNQLKYASQFKPKKPSKEFIQALKIRLAMQRMQQSRQVQPSFAPWMDGDIATRVLERELSSGNRAVASEGDMASFNLGNESLRIASSQDIPVNIAVNNEAFFYASNVINRRKMRSFSDEIDFLSNQVR